MGAVLNLNLLLLKQVTKLCIQKNVIYRTQILCVVLPVEKCDIYRLTVTLTETQTGTPHHCQESRISIHAVTTERNSVQLAQFKEVTCNEKL